MRSLEINEIMKFTIFSSEHMIYIFYTYAKKKFIIKDSWTHLVKKKYANSGFTPDFTPILPRLYPDFTPNFDSNPSPICLNRSNICVFSIFQIPLKVSVGRCGSSADAFLSQAVPRRPDKNL